MEGANELQIDVEWDSKIPYDKRTEAFVGEYGEKNLRDGFKVALDFGIVGLRGRYVGNLSSKRSVESYLWSVTNAIEGARGSYGRCVEEKGSGRIDYIVDKFDINEEGKKGLTVKFGEIDDPRSLRMILRGLEERRLIVARGEDVNVCDYWHGFFGTSNDCWSGSFYEEGNPGERALQLAHELEAGVRGEKDGFWFFPGYNYILSEDNLSEKEKEVVRGINSVLEESINLEEGVSRVVERLREGAGQYFDVVSKAE
jgi:hypothetical protein